MNSRRWHFWSIVLGVVAALLLSLAAAAGELPASAMVLDGNTVMYMRPIPLVSPDGKFVAYVSRGYVCVAEIETGTTRRLAEVPRTWSHVFASIDETREGGDPDSLHRTLDQMKLNELQAQVKNEVSEFQWTADSTAIVYAVSHWDDEQKATQVHIWRAPLAGEAKEIAHGLHPSSTRRGPGGKITRDGKYLVGNFGRHRSLIWDLATNRPRATTFNYLAPSPTSGHWIGSEKDTRQLVIVDENFKIVNRYEEVLPLGQYGFDMIWSPDERFVLWREQVGIDHYSNWVGSRFDLQTREREIFTGDYMDERVEFTGFRGEFIRVGSKGVQQNYTGLALSENYVGIVADGKTYLRRFWSRRADPPGMTSKVRMIRDIPHVTWSPDFELFTIALPREQGPFNYVLHLADRNRYLWRLPGTDSDRHISPYNVAGFALDGEVIIAYDSTRLFALPIDVIQTPENKIR